MFIFLFIGSCANEFTSIENRRLSFADQQANDPFRSRSLSKSLHEGSASQRWRVSPKLCKAQVCNVGHIEEPLTKSLSKAGYTDLRYNPIPNGFTIVTEKERISEDGKPKSNDCRWVRHTSTCKTKKPWYERLLHPDCSIQRYFIFHISEEDIRLSPSQKAPIYDQLRDALPDLLEYKNVAVNIAKRKLVVFVYLENVCVGDKIISHQYDGPKISVVDHLRNSNINIANIVKDLRIE